MSTASQVMDRVIRTIREETDGLRRDAGFDVHAASLRKHRLLLDLDHLPREGVSTDRLDELKAAIAENRTELDARLAVARRIAAIAIDVVREDGRDGTYQASETRP